MAVPDLNQLADAARDASPVTGLTHDFYLYPARFSPVFASAAIEVFSRPAELVLDPFMGGGTTVIEAMCAGRRAIGADINSLAVFLARVKTTPLSAWELSAIDRWVSSTIPTLRYDAPNFPDACFDARTRNLDIARARPIKKAIRLALSRLGLLPTENCRAFARCLLLRCAQWALDNRKRTITLAEFRGRISHQATAMIAGNREFGRSIAALDNFCSCELLNASATELHTHPFFAKPANRVDLVVCSPPYPGIHVLYHRWQVDGRKETPAPYWIADCQDGEGAAFYTFGDRRADGLTGYFEKLRAAFHSIRKVMKNGGHVVQMVSFHDRRRHLARYLYAMASAGFEEVKGATRRIWREVPSRKWHANLNGKTGASREVVLIHRAA